MSINKVVISGNLTRDPELRTTPNGMAVLTIGMAVNDRHRNSQTGEWEDYANFVNCIVFGKRAEALASHLSKGSKVAIEGKLHYSQWESDRQRRSKIEVVVDEIEFFSAKQGEGAVGGNARQTQQPQGTDPYDGIYAAEDIPF